MAPTAGIEPLLRGRCQLGRGVRTGPPKTKFRDQSSLKLSPPVCGTRAGLCQESAPATARAQQLDTDPEQFPASNGHWASP